MNAPFGMDARMVRKRSWLAGEVGNKNRRDVPSFMGSILLYPRHRCKDTGSADPSIWAIPSGDRRQHAERPAPLTLDLGLGHDANRPTHLRHHTVGTVPPSIRYSVPV